MFKTTSEGLMTSCPPPPPAVKTLNSIKTQLANCLPIQPAVLEAWSSLARLCRSNEKAVYKGKNVANGETRRAGTKIRSRAGK